MLYFSVFILLCDFHIIYWMKYEIFFLWLYKNCGYKIVQIGYYTKTELGLNIFFFIFVDVFSGKAEVSYEYETDDNMVTMDIGTSNFTKCIDIWGIYSFW